VVDGRIVRWSMDTISPFMMFDRAPWYHDSAWMLPAFLGALAVLLITALFWPIRALIRRRFGAALALSKRELLSFRLVRLFAAAIGAVVIGWVFAFTTMMGDFNNLSPAMDPVVWTLQVLTFVTFLGGLAVFAWDAVNVWRGPRGWKAKAWSVVLVLSGVLIVWVGFSFKLLSLGANY
jgi:hypothetical protein